MKRFLIGLTVVVMLLTMLPRHAFGTENAAPNPGDRIAIEGPPPLEEPTEPVIPCEEGCEDECCGTDFPPSEESGDTPNLGDQIAIEGPPPLEEPAEPAPISEDPAGYAGVPASNPQTGDEASLLAMGITAALSAAGIAFCLPGLRKQRKKDEE